MGKTMKIMEKCFSFPFVIHFSSKPEKKMTSLTHFSDTQLKCCVFSDTTQDALGVLQVCFPMNKHNSLVYVIFLLSSTLRPATVRGMHCAIDLKKGTCGKAADLDILMFKLERGPHPYHSYLVSSAPASQPGSP